MVELKRYTLDMFNDLLDMHKSQDANIAQQGIPQLGFMAVIDNKPGAAGFLRMIEGSYAMIDTLVSNAALCSEQRHECLSKVVDALINAAKELKLNGIVCHTKDAGILQRAEEIGFEVVPQTIIAMPFRH